MSYLSNSGMDDFWPIVDRGPGYMIEQRPDGLSLTSIGAWTSEAADVMRSGRVSDLSLSYTAGFSESSLNFIEDWPIRSLTLIDRTMTDIRGLERLRNLEELFVQADERVQFNAMRLPRLSSLGTYWSHVASSLDGAELPIRDLALWTLRSPDLSPLAGLRRLERIEILGSRSLESLHGIEGLPVRRIRVVSAPRLERVSALAELAALDELWFEKCRSITKLEEIACASSSLRELWLDDCGRIESLAPIEGLKRLELVVLSGDTYVVDGDLKPLTRLPRLRTLRTTFRRHYNLDPAAIAPPN